MTLTHSCCSSKMIVRLKVLRHSIVCTTPRFLVGTAGESCCSHAHFQCIPTSAPYLSHPVLHSHFRALSYRDVLEKYEGGMGQCPQGRRNTAWHSTISGAQSCVPMTVQTIGQKVFLYEASLHKRIGNLTPGPLRLALHSGMDNV